ncbi:hypothetical protein GCM10007298_10850 [Williamsia phyllosphaerae]|uniref:Uncharacterized protein n=1 Tax=Williamsia phyllosphaerae TaxID=885042 RepID=A0ABQ1UDS6_9NOCA|nr:hypothetical protein GCM10007298_10850 [Williamsia phyllosphaerae]
MKLRRLLGDRLEQVTRSWDLSRLGKDAEPVYWMGGFGSERPDGASGIRFGVIAVDIWQKQPSRYAALRAEEARNADRSRLARWAASAANDHRYGPKGEPLLEASKLAPDDLKAIRAAKTTAPGSLLYVACALATAVENQRCWKNPLLDTISIRIDLADEIRQIAETASSIRDAEESLGPKPAGDLADDTRIVEIYDRRRAPIDERLTLLRERVEALSKYWDNLKNLDLEFDRLEWIREKSTDDGRQGIVAVEQERQSLSSVARRTEEAEGVSGAVVQSLIDDAHRILELNENN